LRGGIVGEEDVSPGGGRGYVKMVCAPDYEVE